MYVRFHGPSHDIHYTDAKWGELHAQRVCEAVESGFGRVVDSCTTLEWIQSSYTALSERETPWYEKDACRMGKPTKPWVIEDRSCYISGHCYTENEAVCLLTRDC